MATALVQLAVPMSATEEAYRLMLSRSPDAIAAARGLGPGQTLNLFRRLESALTDMMLLYPVLSSGQSVKVAADTAGMHIARALELAEWTPRYPPGVALRCRQALALGLESLPPAGGREHCRDLVELTCSNGPTRSSRTSAINGGSTTWCAATTTCAS